jgi:hypothetical protein
MVPSASQLEVTLRLFVVPNAEFSLRVVLIVMVLVNS